MNVTKTIAIFSITAIFPFFIGCDQKKGNPENATVSHENVAQSFAQKVAIPESVPNSLGNEIVVSTVLNAGKFVCVEGESNGVKVWVSVKKLSVKQGDTLQYESGQTMYDFYSKTLDRTFKEIIFSNLARVVNSDGTVVSTPAVVMPQVENPHKNGLPTTLSEATKISVAKVEGGYTVEELFSKKDELNGQTVKVRGMVVKFLPGIMKKNWIHLQDGSGAEKTHDLTITTQDTVNNGDIIVCTGKLVVDKDFGQGYAYSLIIEEALITTE